MDVNNNVERIYRPVKQDLLEAEKFIEDILAGSSHKGIANINGFLMQSPGKKLRPALTFLSYGALASGFPARLGRRELIAAASSVELLHMASLIHDDVIDKAEFRHNKQSVNARWGKDISILLGDYLFSSACTTIVSTKDPELFGCIARGANQMCEGELSQVCDRGNFALTEGDYLDMIERKTASLFSTACYAGALVTDSPRELTEALGNFGRYFGMTYQIVDDYLDIVSTEEKLGKHPGQDILSGEMTLPIIFLFEAVSRDKKDELIRMMSSPNGKTFRLLRDEMLSHEATRRTEDIIHSFIGKAQKELEAVPDGPCKTSLNELLDFAKGKVREYSYR